MQKNWRKKNKKNIGKSKAKGLQALFKLVVHIDMTKWILLYQCSFAHLQVCPKPFYLTKTHKVFVPVMLANLVLFRRPCNIQCKYNCHLASVGITFNISETSWMGYFWSPLDSQSQDLTKNQVWNITHHASYITHHILNMLWSSQDI